MSSEFPDYDCIKSTPPEDEACEYFDYYGELRWCCRDDHTCPFAGDRSACIADAAPDYDPEEEM